VWGELEKHDIPAMVLLPSAIRACGWRSPSGPRGGQGFGDTALRRRQDLSFPLGSSAHSQGVTMFTEELSWLKAEDLDWVMGRGVCEWLGWKA